MSKVSQTAADDTGGGPNDKKPAEPAGFVGPADHALGRSRGGLSSKLHLCCDGRGLPLSFTVTAGQAGDNPQLLAVLGGISVHTGRPGRRRRPPLRDDQLARRRARGPGRPYAFDAELYKQRNVVERCFNRLKQWRGIATRYDKTARNYRGGVLLASLVLWTRA